MSVYSVRPILLVEDNPHDELLTLRALRRVNLVNRIDVVRDGQQALDYLLGNGDGVAAENPQQKQNELPLVVLLDIGLPRLSGLEVLEKVRADPRTALLPVVIFTSSDEDTDRLQSYAHRCNSYVRKPVDFNHFAETVARMGMYWLATNSCP